MRVAKANSPRPAPVSGGATYLATAQGLITFSATGGFATTIATGNYERVAVTN